MALRVLLADENVTIKKVMQLSLQDYAVNVKSVNLGVDVLDIAREFQPDVVFADILLQKRNGYEVCTDFKNDSSLSNIPFVLMWSSFMEIDKERFTTCGADGELEKPFDKHTLRQIVQDKVAKVSSNQLSPFIEAPDAPPIEQTAPNPQSPPSFPEPPGQSQPEEVPELITPIDLPPSFDTGVTPAPSSSSDWDMDSFDDIGDFVQKPLGEVPEGNPAETNTKNDESWQQEDLSDFKLELNADSNPSLSSEFSIDYQAAENTNSGEASVPVVMQGDPLAKEPDEGTEDIVPLPRETSKAPMDLSAAVPKMTEAELERIVMAQNKEIIEAIAWKIVPDLAEKIIREKMDELMKESEL